VAYKTKNSIISSFIGLHAATRCRIFYNCCAHVWWKHLELEYEYASVIVLLSVHWPFFNLKTLYASNHSFTFLQAPSCDYSCFTFPFLLCIFGVMSVVIIEFPRKAILCFFMHRWIYFSLLMCKNMDLGKVWVGKVFGMIADNKWANALSS